MRNRNVLLIAAATLSTGCLHKGPNPQDPFENFNRKIYRFNTVLDDTLLKPPAKLYRKIVPGPVRKGINNFYNNLDMIPTVVNDVLQARGTLAIKDTWRFLINSTFGLGGVIDVAATWQLPPHTNDLGLTFALWGDKNSPYLVIPFLGPSTLRDGAGMLFQFALYSPYVYLHSTPLIYSLLGLRYVDLRAQLMDTEQILDEALDRYGLLRDAYLQHRNYLLHGGEQDDGTLYVEETSSAAPAGVDYVPE